MFDLRISAALCLPKGAVLDNKKSVAALTKSVQLLFKPFQLVLSRG
jgi:hypothetical protein